ncbi:hypothetical protein GGQ82_004224, partial [Sphingobium olei]
HQIRNCTSICSCRRRPHQAHRSLRMRFKTGSQIIGFLADNLSTYHLMLRQESLVDGQIDKAVLLRVTEREITAGRMKGNDPLRAFAEGGEYIRDNPMEGLFHADPSADDKPVLN